MARFGKRQQAADWTPARHVPAIECPERIDKDETVRIKVRFDEERETSSPAQWGALRIPSRRRVLRGPEDRASVHLLLGHRLLQVSLRWDSARPFVVQHPRRPGGQQEGQRGLISGRRADRAD